MMMTMTTSLFQLSAWDETNTFRGSFESIIQGQRNLSSKTWINVIETILELNCTYEKVLLIMELFQATTIDKMASLFMAKMTSVSS